MLNIRKLPPRSKPVWALGVIIMFSMLAGFYYNMRYTGMNPDGDVIKMVAAARGIQVSGRLDEAGRYSNGYNYGAILAFVSELTGLRPDTMTSWGNAWIMVFLLAAYITYRELMGDDWLAVLSTLLLIIFPDLMFYIMRGSHERVTWLLALLMLFLLVRSLRHIKQLGLLLVDILAFYLVFWAMASTNIYFASSFASAIFISFLGSQAFDFLKRFHHRTEQINQRFVQRLVTISLVCLILVFIFITYAYPPALSYYFRMQDFLARAGILVLGAQEESGPPLSYSYLGRAWLSLGTYLALVWPQFLIAGVSFGRWLADMRKVFTFDDRRWFLWWLYTAFGVLLVVGTIADYAGFMQENLQMRMFTPFALFIAPLAALVIRAAFAWLQRLRPRLAVLLAGMLIAYGLLACMLKVTNDPLVSNVWLFYAPGEQRAGVWMEQKIDNQVVWADTWSRLPSLYEYMEDTDPDQTGQYVAGKVAIETPYILISEHTWLRANRVGFTLPAVADHNLIYDNGFARLYYRIPLTPYQK